MGASVGRGVNVGRGVRVGLGVNVGLGVKSRSIRLGVFVGAAAGRGRHSGRREALMSATGVAGADVGAIGSAVGGTGAAVGAVGTGVAVATAGTRVDVGCAGGAGLGCALTVLSVPAALLAAGVAMAAGAPGATAGGAPGLGVSSG